MTLKRRYDTLDIHSPGWVLTVPEIHDGSCLLTKLSVVVTGSSDIGTPRKHSAVKGVLLLPAYHHYQRRHDHRDGKRNNKNLGIEACEIYRAACPDKEFGSCILYARHHLHQTHYKSISSIMMLIRSAATFPDFSASYINEPVQTTVITIIRACWSSTEASYLPGLCLTLCYLLFASITKMKVQQPEYTRQRVQSVPPKNTQKTWV